MKRILVVVCVLCSSLLFAGRSRQAAPVQRAEVDVKSLTPEITGQTPRVTQKRDGLRLKLLPAGTIFLDFLPQGAYISSLKFDQNENMYVGTVFPSERMELVRFNAQSGAHQKIAIPGLGEGSLAGFEVDKQGRVYASINWPDYSGAITILAADGSLLSRIPTGTFLAANLATDSDGRVWAAGQLFESSRNGNFRSDTQVRIYDTSGNLIGVPAGGLDPADSSMSTFVVDPENTKLISHVNSVAYNFSWTKIIGARAYPFQEVTDIHSGNIQSSAASGRIVKGVAQVNHVKVWYGNLKNKRGTYGNGFVALSTLRGEPLTPEIELPSEYQALAGVDSQGNLWVFSKISDQLVLNEFKILVRVGGVLRELASLSTEEAKQLGQ